MLHHVEDCSRLVWVRDFGRNLWCVALSTDLASETSRALAAFSVHIVSVEPNLAFPFLAIDLRTT